MTTADMDLPTVVIHDEAGRSLLCTVEHALTLNGQSYTLLSPVATPVTLFAWEGAEEEEEEEEEPILVEDEDEITTIFPIAKAVLAEQNLELIWSAITLTVEGEIPDLTLEEDDYDGAERNGTDPETFEEFHLLARFYHEEQEYALYIPLDPFLMVARMDQGKPYLLNDNEYEAIAPLLEEALSEHLEDEYEDNPGA